MLSIGKAFQILSPLSNKLGVHNYIYLAFLFSIEYAEQMSVIELEWELLNIKSKACCGGCFITKYHLYSLREEEGQEKLSLISYTSMSGMLLFKYGKIRSH